MTEPGMMERRIVKILILMFAIISLALIWCACKEEEKESVNEDEVPSFQMLVKMTESERNERLSRFSGNDLRTAWGMPDENMKIMAELPLDRWFYKEFSIEVSYYDDERVHATAIYKTEGGATIW